MDRPELSEAVNDGASQQPARKGNATPRGGVRPGDRDRRGCVTDVSDYQALLQSFYLASATTIQQVLKCPSNGKHPANEAEGRSPR